MKLFCVPPCFAGGVWLAASSMLAQTPAAPARFSVLVFSRTTMYRHAAIPRIGAENDFAVDATEDSSAFTERMLKHFKRLRDRRTSIGLRGVHRFGLA
jgi:hypothetical protein